MGNSAPEKIAEEYLKRLGVAARGLPRAERRELRAQIEEHLRLAVGDEPGEAEVRAALERLGDPDEIVAEQYGRREARRGIGGQAVGAIALLLVGGFLAGIGWVVGVVMLWTSVAWTTREKLIGTLLVPGGLATALYLPLLAGGAEVCSGPGVRFGGGRAITHVAGTCTGATSTLDQVLVVGLFVFLVIAPIATAIFLARRARPLAA
jgi:hypothetical protein